jgi:predicted small lipoprotein YifL
MDDGMRRFKLSILLLATALALGGCGRKNLPVPPQPKNTPIGESKMPNQDAPASVANFRRANGLGATSTGLAGSSDSSLSISPAEVSRNPNAEKKSFPLDFLLN